VLSIAQALQLAKLLGTNLLGLLGEAEQPAESAHSAGEVGVGCAPGEFG